MMRLPGVAVIFSRGAPSPAAVLLGFMDATSNCRLKAAVASRIGNRPGSGGSYFLEQDAEKVSWSTDPGRAWPRPTYANQEHTYDSFRTLPGEGFRVCPHAYAWRFREGAYLRSKFCNLLR